MRARYYNVDIKRFINQDILEGNISDSPSLNRYAYVHGNPISQVDPFGLSPENAGTDTFWAHVILGVLGMLPYPIGPIFDIADAMVYAFIDGDYLSAVQSLISAVLPFPNLSCGVKLALSVADIGINVIFAVEGAIEGNWLKVAGAGLGIAFRGADIYNGYIKGQWGVCFTGNTLVYTAEGLKEIKEIKQGDLVYSYDFESEEVVLKEVESVSIQKKDTIYHIYTETEEIETTEEHPFYVVDKGWVSAGNLEVSDKMLSADGEYVEVISIEIEKLDKPVEVYNFEVRELHNYFVSDELVLVHNKCNDFDVEGNFTNKSDSGIQEYDILEYGKFNTPETVGDGLTGHELLQNAWLESNGIAKRGSGLSRKNPAIALKEEPMHKFISSKQKSLKLNKNTLKNVSWRKNISDNIKIMIEAGIPRDKIAELAWKAREFAIKNNL